MDWTHLNSISSWCHSVLSGLQQCITVERGGIELWVRGWVGTWWGSFLPHFFSGGGGGILTGEGDTGGLSMSSPQHQYIGWVTTIKRRIWFHISETVLIFNWAKHEACTSTSSCAEKRINLENLRDLFISCPSKTSLENGNFKWKFKHFCRSLHSKVCAYRLYKGDRKEVAFLSWKTTYPLKWLRLNLCWCCHSLWSQRLHIAAIL